MNIQGLTEPSTSGWASPIVLPKKKNGDVWLCVDNRKLNERTVNDAYPLSRLNNLLKRLSGSRILTTIALNFGYWQVDVEENSRQFTAFTTPKGIHKFKVTPPGLKNAPATFMRLVDEVLS